MINLIKEALKQILNQIDDGSCKLTEEKQRQLLNLLIDINNEPAENQIMSKQSAADYLGISRATFDNRIRDGLLPQGRHYNGLKELIWFKYEIDLANNKTKN